MTARATHPACLSLLVSLIFMSESWHPSQAHAAHLQSGDERDLVVEAIDHLRRVLPASGSALGAASLAGQKENLQEWARGLGLILSADEVAPKLLRGGQEHDFYREGDRIIKVTRGGVFGLSPGIELALVSSSRDARTFHLWEATPYEYLERLRLMNELVPGLNRLEGLLVQEGDLAIVTSQPAFEINPVPAHDIDAWFSGLGFAKIARSAFYRADDNLGIFDAHSKNLVRAGGVLIPFDVIPCHPAGGFLKFIEDTLAAGHTLEAIRTTHFTA